MSLTGNNYCKVCGDLIDPDKEPCEDVCRYCINRLQMKEMEKSTGGGYY